MLYLLSSILLDSGELGSITKYEITGLAIYSLLKFIMSWSLTFLLTDSKISSTSLTVSSPSVK